MTINSKLLPEFPKIVESGQYESIYYLKFDNGILIQAGSFGNVEINPSSNQQVENKLNVPFKNTSYKCVIGRAGSGDNYTYIRMSVVKKTKDNIIIELWNDGTNLAKLSETDWIAIGEWK